MSDPGGFSFEIAQRKIIEAQAPLADFSMSGFVEGFHGLVHFRLETMGGNQIVDCCLAVEVLARSRFPDFLAAYHECRVRAVIETAEPPKHRRFGDPE